MNPLTLITGPAKEPVELEEAKEHLRVTHAAQDDLIDGLIRTARQMVEELTGRALITQTWEMGLDGWPVADAANPWGAIHLPKVPLQSVTSVSYTDENGASQTFSSSKYTVDTRSHPGRIVLAYQESWPTIRSVPNAIVVRFVAGYGDNANLVPEPIRQAMKVHLGTLWTHAEDVITGTIVQPLNTVRQLLAPYRMFWI